MSVVNFPFTFKTTRDNIGMSEGAAISLFPFDIGDPTASIANIQTRLRGSSNIFVKGSLHQYCDVFNYLPATYATMNVIAEAVHNIPSARSRPE